MFLRGECPKTNYLSYKGCSVFNSFISDYSEEYGANIAAYTKKSLQWLLGKI